MNVFKVGAKTLLAITAVLPISGCSVNQKYTVFAKVYNESSSISNGNERIIFGEEYSSSLLKSTVYFYNKNKKSIQLQPSKSGDVIYNVNSSWKKNEDIKSIGLKNVYYKVGSRFFTDKYELINENKIEVLEIETQMEINSMLIINKFLVINVDDITAFGFNYKVEELL